ncbi:hypothetical protein QM369_08505, partial [Streptococcus lutetiensis]
YKAKKNQLVLTDIFLVYLHNLISYKNTPIVRFFLSNFWGAGQLGLFYFYAIFSKLITGFLYVSEQICYNISR